MARSVANSFTPRPKQPRPNTTKRPGSILNLPDGVRQKVTDFIGPKNFVPLVLKIDSQLRAVCSRPPEGGDTKINVYTRGYQTAIERKAQPLDWELVSTAYVSAAGIAPFLIKLMFHDDEYNEHFPPTLVYPGTTLKWFCAAPCGDEGSHLKSHIAEMLNDTVFGPFALLGTIRVGENDANIFAEDSDY